LCTPQLDAQARLKNALNYRRDIDGLRAVAVIGVLVCHAFPTLLPGGFVGVDIFFIISGFLISSIIFAALATKSFSFFNFYAKRIKRIFPPLAVVLIASLVAGWFVLLPDEYALLGKHAAYAVGFVLNIVLSKETGYFDAAAATKPLLHLWSLCIEEQFYILWPFVLFLGWRFRKRLPILLALAFVGSFYSNVVHSATAPSAAFFLAQNRSWELLLGSLLAYYSTVVEDLPASYAGAASVVGLGLLLVAFFGIDASYAYPGFWALFPTVGTCLTILAGPSAWVNRKLLSHPTCVSIGLFSYPLYLWHWPLLFFNSTIQFGNPGVASKIAVLAGSFGLAWCSDRFLERRIRFGKLDWAPAWAVPAALAVTLVAIATVGGAIVAHAGYTARFARRIPVETARKPVEPVESTGQVEHSRVESSAAPSSLPAPVPARSSPKAPLPSAGNADVAKEIHDNKEAVSQDRPNQPFVQDILHYDYLVNMAEWRHKKCFLDESQTAESFAPDCVDHDPENQPLVLLWGDSNAGSLSAGLRDLQHKSHSFRLAQLTASGCAPVIGYTLDIRPNCKGINDAIYARLAELKPDLILLSMHGYFPNPASLALWEKSIAAIRATVSVRIILLGPTPTHLIDPKTSIARQFPGIPEIDIPKRIKDEIYQGPELSEETYRQMASAVGIEYISVFDTLCDAEGCLVRVPYDESHDDLVQFDTEHLTAAGSRYVVNAIAPAIFKRH
jgi:peptidoglycan/LPS O-acetylase OafA/YrhL